MDAAKLNALKLINEAFVPYVLMSGFYGDNGGDLDLLIPLDGMTSFSEFCRKHEVHEQRRPPQFRNHFFYFLYAKGYRPLRIHVKYEATFYDKRADAFRVFREDNMVLASREPYGSWFIPGAWHLILLYAAKCAFVEKSRITAPQILNLRNFILRNKNKLRDPVQADFAQKILGIVVPESPESASDALAVMLSSNFPFAGGSVLNQQFRFYNRIGMPAYTLLVVGCDGSGKSSMLNLLRHRLELPTQSLYGGLGSAGWIFPKIGCFRHRVVSSRRLTRTFGLFLWIYVLFPFELICRSIRRTFFSRNAVLLIDRFPEFSFVGKWASMTANLYKMILPKPSMIVEMKAPIPILLERRGNELNAHSALVKLNEAHSLAGYFLRRGALGIEIDSSSISIEESVAIVVSRIWADPRFVSRMLKPASVPRYAGI